MIDELSIIIPTLNEEKYLPLLLNSILKQNFNGKLEVIIVDAHSSDKTVAVAKTFQPQFTEFKIIQTQPGTAAQRNLGAQAAKYQYLLFIDADIILTSNTLKKVIRKISKDEFVAIATQWPAGKNILDHLFIALMYPGMIITSLFEPVTPGAFIMTTKKVHTAIEGFTQGVILGEDMEYGKKAIKSGAKYIWAYTTFIFHSPRRARKVGRIGLVKTWISSYFYSKKHGLIYNNDNYSYPFGNYS